MCLAPCYQGCTDERYGEESAAVERFLATRGESRLVQLRTQRDEASANLEFESAASIHTQVQRAEAVRALAPEIVRPMSQLRAVILQAVATPAMVPPAVGPTAPSSPVTEVAVFLYAGGRLRGPAMFSTLGMRIQNEQSGSSSLFAQPMALEAGPEEQGTEKRGTGDQGKTTDEEGTQADEPAAPGSTKAGAKAAAKVARGMLEARLEGVLADLMSAGDAPNGVVRQGHLALLKRWYYRPEVKRPGEVFFLDDEGQWPVKAILRGIGRIAAKSLAPQAVP